MNGKTTGIRFETDLIFTVGDTIDFCPGNLSNGTEVLGTIPSAFLEANGIAHDVGFETTFRTNPKQWTFTAIPPDWDKTEKEPPSTCNVARSAVSRHFPSQAPACENDDDAVPTVNPRDPNDIIGPPGFGDNAWLLPDALLPYTIHFAGFLPVNDATHRGEGFVSYIVRSIAGKATGTRLDNSASIVFDVNDPLLTNAVFNMIDRGGPTSRVTALPAVTTTTSIPVNWSGADDNGGSGIASFDLFASDNGGPFQLWLNDTAATSGSFPGADGHSYGFYSIATDNLGHVETTPTKAQTRTTVDATPPAIEAVETVTDARGKKVTQVIVAFDEAIGAAAAQTTTNYGLVFQKGRKVKPAPIGAATWDGASMEVTLTPVKAIAVKKLASYTLTVLGAGTLADAAGNGFDGDGDGQPGGDFVLPLAQATPRSVTQRATLAAVDELLVSSETSRGLVVDDRLLDLLFDDSDSLRRKLRERLEASVEM